MSECDTDIVSSISSLKQDTAEEEPSIIGSELASNADRGEEKTCWEIPILSPDKTQQDMSATGKNTGGKGEFFWYLCVDPKCKPFVMIFNMIERNNKYKKETKHRYIIFFINLHISEKK